jgi:hypothetical protein
MYSVQSDAGQGWLCDSSEGGTMPLPLVMPFGDDPDIQARVGTFGCSPAGSMGVDVHLWRQTPTGNLSVDHGFAILVTQSG